MRKNTRDNRPYLRPVTRVELSEKNIKLRWIAIVVLLAVAVVSIGYGISAALSTEPGWQEISVQPQEVNYSADFVLMYNFGAGDINPTAAYKQLEALYSDLTVEAFRLFSPNAVPSDNIAGVNGHVNEPVAVDPALYSVLDMLSRYDSRHAFLAPVTALYDAVFLSAGDGEAEAYDPMMEPERAEQVREIAAYCANPAHVSLEILGENQVRLKVSEEYLAYARENGIETFLDFGWMTNAFVADFMAEALMEQGFTWGYLASYDGFTRNLDVSGGDYTVNFFDRQGNAVQIPATLRYGGPESIVFLRNYPLSEQDRWHYYAYASGEITTVFLDPDDGFSKSATDSLMAYSGDHGCGEILLQIAPVFTADSLDVDRLREMAGEGIYALWAENTAVYHTQDTPALFLKPDSSGQTYILKYVN